jgi:hypothetical protein
LVKSGGDGKNVWEEKNFIRKHVQSFKKSYEPNMTFFHLRKYQNLFLELECRKISNAVTLSQHSDSRIFSSPEIEPGPFGGCPYHDYPQLHSLGDLLQKVLVTLCALPIICLILPLLQYNFICLNFPPAGNIQCPTKCDYSYQSRSRCIPHFFNPQPDFQTHLV